MARGKTWVRNCRRCGENYSMPFGSHGDHPGCKVRYVVGLDCNAGDMGDPMNWNPETLSPEAKFIFDVSNKPGFYSVKPVIRAAMMRDLCREHGASCAMLAIIEDGRISLIDEYLDEESILG